MNNTIRLIFSFVFLTTVLTACQSEATSPETDSVKASATIHKAEITVYKSPTCGCCKDWVTYLEEEGFNVIPDPKLKSCHTAIVEGYLVEGHVPASDIERLLRTRPTNIKGLSAPGIRLCGVVIHRIR